MTSPFQEKITKVYNALTNKINSSISTHNNSSSAHSSLLSLKANISDLGATAFSNDYTDLDNLPSIPTHTSDLTNDGAGNGSFVETSELGDVAFSDDYGDLENTPTIPSDITDLTDITQVLTDLVHNSDLSPVAFTNEYGDLSNIPSSFTPKSHTHGNLQNDGSVGTSNNASKNVVTDSNGKITTEAKPTIPSASSTVPSADTSSGSYGSGTVYARSNHTHPKSSLYAEATHNHTKSQITDFPSIPSKTSDLTNDSNFISTSSTNGLIKNDGSIDTSSYITSSAITSHNSNNSAHSSLFNGKANSVHTHSTSDITNLPTIPNNLEDLTLGTGAVQTNTGLDVMTYDDTIDTLYWGLGNLSLDLNRDEVYYGEYEIATLNDIPSVPTDLSDLSDNTNILHFNDYIAYDDMSTVPLSDFNNDLTELMGISGYYLIQEDSDNGTHLAFNEKLIYDYENTEKVYYDVNGNGIDTDNEIATLGDIPNISTSNWTEISLTNGKLYVNTDLRMCELHYSKSHNLTSANTWTFVETISQIANYPPKTTLYVHGSAREVMARVFDTGSLQANFSAVGQRSITFNLMWHY